MSLQCRRKLEYPEETHVGTGRTFKLYGGSVVVGIQTDDPNAARQQCNFTLSDLPSGNGSLHNGGLPISREHRVSHRPSTAPYQQDKIIPPIELFTFV